jgi:hypothetical protein
MIEEDMKTASEGPRTAGPTDNLSEEPSREEEKGESSEPDAPTSGVENAGMNTILDGDLGTGVQTDADDE